MTAHRKVIVRQEDVYTARGIFRMWLPGRLVHEYLMLPLGKYHLEFRAERSLANRHRYDCGLDHHCIDRRVEQRSRDQAGVTADMQSIPRAFFFVISGFFILQLFSQKKKGAVGTRVVYLWLHSCCT